MNAPDVHHLAAAYALDAVDAHERHAFEAHLHACQVCRADVADDRETLAKVAAASPIAPPADLRQRVLAEVAETRQLSPLLPQGTRELLERRRRQAATLLAAAAVVILFVSGAFLIGRDTSPRFADELAAVLDQPDARLVTLEPSEGEGIVRIGWSAASGRAVVLGDQMAPSPDGHAYELWLIDPAGPVAMQLLERADDGSLRAAFDIDHSPTAWGITIEPDHGSPTPTGKVLFIAEV